MLIFAAIECDEQQNERTVSIDENIFCRISNGEKNAFCLLYEQTSNIIYSYALSILRNQDDAEDAMQETFMHVRAAAHLYKPMGKPLAWMFTITKNVCLMKFRKERKESIIPFEEIKTQPDFSRIEDDEDRIVLEAAFKILSKEECKIIVLHAVSGLKHKEISEILEIPLSTVLSKYNRGIKKLRKELEEMQ